MLLDNIVRLINLVFHIDILTIERHLSVVITIGAYNQTEERFKTIKQFTLFTIGVESDQCLRLQLFSGLVLSKPL